MKIIKIDDGFEIKNTIYDKENFLVLDIVKN